MACTKISFPEVMCTVDSYTIGPLGLHFRHTVLLASEEPSIARDSCGTVVLRVVPAAWVRYHYYDNDDDVDDDDADGDSEEYGGCGDDDNGDDDNDDGNIDDNHMNLANLLVTLFSESSRAFDNPLTLRNIFLAFAKMLELMSSQSTTRTSSNHRTGCALRGHPRS